MSMVQKTQGSIRLPRRSFLLAALLALALCGTGMAQDFSRLELRVNTAQPDRRQYLVDSFLTIIGDFPYIEQDTVVYFLYQDKGNAHEVYLASDANSWSNTASPLQRLSTTDLWYRKTSYEKDARLDYKFVVDDQWILDPDNPYTVSGGYGPNSELRMPAYVPPTEIIPRSGIAHGTLRDTAFASAALGNIRSVRIYLPPGYEQTADSYPVVLFHDGFDYITLGHAVTVLDNLIHDGRIPPVIAVFVPPVDRDDEYAGSGIDTFASFITGEIMPAIDRAYRTRRDPAARVVMGASNGGNISLYLAMMYPDVFGNAAAQSSNVIPIIQATFRTSAHIPIRRLYLDLGTYDIPMLLPRVHDFVSVLQSEGYSYNFLEVHEGHSWGNWRAHIDDALTYLFDGLTAIPSAPAPVPPEMTIRSTAPNPATTFATVHFTQHLSGSVRLLVFDTVGRLVRSEAPRSFGPGDHRISVPLDGISPGTYFLSLVSATGRVSTRLLVR